MFIGTLFSAACSARRKAFSLTMKMMIPAESEPVTLAQRCRHVWLPVLRKQRLISARCWGWCVSGAHCWARRSLSYCRGWRQDLDNLIRWSQLMMNPAESARGETASRGKQRKWAKNDSPALIVLTQNQKMSRMFGHLRIAERLTS